MPNPTFHTITQSMSAGASFDGVAPDNLASSEITPNVAGIKVVPEGELHGGLFDLEVDNPTLDVAAVQLPRAAVPAVARPVAWELGAYLGDATSVTVSVVDKDGNTVHVVYKSTAWGTDSPDGTLTLLASETPNLRPGHKVKVVAPGNSTTQTCTVGRAAVTQ